ncbi:hypothetical protein [Oceanisphaera ostreae]|uniref:Uncharacterized protein n=1 Tax=Oceanisphaera ostreae TaxID=914151 RepID=A0ABW3KDM6_9GAMM
MIRRATYPPMDGGNAEVAEAFFCLARRGGEGTPVISVSFSA